MIFVKGWLFLATIVLLQLIFAKAACHCSAVLKTEYHPTGLNEC